MNYLRTHWLSGAILLILVSCTQVELPQGEVWYRIMTQDGTEGLARFHADEKEKLSGTFYKDIGDLFASPVPVSVEHSRQEVFLQFPDRSRQPFSFQPYVRPVPEFNKDLPEVSFYTTPRYQQIEVQRDSVYARATGYYTSYPCQYSDPFWLIYTRKVTASMNSLDLDMDIYQPVGDSLAGNRPLVMMIHGGAFINGDKRQSEFEDWCRHFASLGYVAASINYRLGFKLDVNRAGYRAVQDARAAMQYLLSRKDLRIDPDRLFVAGTSAGAITALNVAFMRDDNRPEGLEDEGDLDAVWTGTPIPFTIRGVGNFWGAVHDPDMICNPHIRILSIHNANDDIVPYAKGYPFETLFGDIPVNQWLLDEMYGSQYITGRAYEQGLITELITYELPDTSNPTSERHSIHFNTDGTRNGRFMEIQERMTDFFSEAMEPYPVRIRQNGQVFTLSTPSDVQDCSWDVEGGFILNKAGDGIKVLLFPDSSRCSVSVNGVYASGRTFHKTWVKLDRDGFKDGPEAVDLGLSVKWATCDIGASSPTETGDLYTLEDLQSPDFFRTHFGEGWRLPTLKEVEELGGSMYDKEHSVRLENVDTPSGKSIRITGKNGRIMLVPDQNMHWLIPTDPTDRLAVFSLYGESGPAAADDTGGSGRTTSPGGINRSAPIDERFPVRAVREY